MLSANLIVWSMAGALVVWAHLRQDRPHAAALKFVWEQLKPLSLRFPLALMAAGFVAAAMTPELTGSLIGAESGFTGVLIASAIGPLLPGGPMITFPLAISLFGSGFGFPQMVALLTAWACLAGHRVVAFEIPLIGTRFALIRVAASLCLPPLAGWSTLMLEPFLR